MGSFVSQRSPSGSFWVYVAWGDFYSVELGRFFVAGSLEGCFWTHHVRFMDQVLVPCQVWPSVSPGINSGMILWSTKRWVPRTISETALERRAAKALGLL